MEPVNASASPEVPINNNFSTISEFACYLQNKAGCSGLTWAYYGDKWGTYTVTPSPITLTNNATNYLTVNRSSGVQSASTLVDNWDDVVNHARVYILTTSGGNVTDIDKCYTGLNGVHGYMAGGSIGGGGGGGSVKLYPDATELLAESAVTIGVREMNDSAAETTPTTITGTANNNTVQIGPAFENGAVNATELAGGEWTLDLYASVDNTAGDTRAKVSQYLKQAQAGTITITGTGTSRTATITGGTPFVVGDYDAADVSKCAWIRTPTAYLRVSGYTSSSEVTVECKTGYVNDSAVAYSKDKYIAQGTSAEINDTSTGYQVIEWFFNTVACSTTDVVMIRFWASTTATANRTVTINYGGTTNYTHVHTTLPFQHNELAGLNAGDLQHLTATQLAALVLNNQNNSFSDFQLSRAMVKDCASVVIDKGNSGTSTQTYDFSAGSVQTSTATGNHTIAFSNFPPTGNMGYMHIILTNGGAFTITWPTITWLKPDGTTTTSISTYLAANTGRVSLQAAGVDQFMFWSRDAGATVYGVLI